MVIELAHGATAPCARLFSGSGMTRSGSTSLRVPMPVHSGQAPNGELNENDRGSSASKDSPSSTQARCSENVRSRCGSSSSRSTNSRTTRPPASPSAVSTESVRRRLALSLTVSRSTITSIVCFSCFLSFGGSVSGCTDAVDPDAGEALGLQRAEQVDVLALARADDRREHLEAGALLHRQHLVDDLLRRLPGDRLAAVRAVRLAGAGVQQPQVVVDLGDGADGRPRVAVGRLLVDRDGRREALDEVDVGLVHLARGTGARRPTATRRTGAGPRRRSCRRRGWTCRSPESPVNTISASRGRSRWTSLRLCSRAPRTTSRSM